MPTYFPPIFCRLFPAAGPDLGVCYRAGVLLSLPFMRLWSVHPRYFDQRALTACWREALLAQAVLAGRTKGYGSHPQLERFRNHPAPSDAIGAYLRGVADEADARGYRFDRSRIIAADEEVASLQLTTGQLLYEWRHLMSKLEHRSPIVAVSWSNVHLPMAHPLFTVLEGPIAPWERLKA